MVLYVKIIKKLKKKRGKERKKNTFIYGNKQIEKF